MSEPINPLRPVQAQTQSRPTAEDQDRALEQQRTWVLRKQKGQERRQGDRRQGERRQKERRLGERRSQDRRQGERLSEERRKGERRKGDRRKGDRRVSDRRAAEERPIVRTEPESNDSAQQARPPRRGIIDDYA